MHERRASNYGRVTPTINSSQLLKEMRKKLEGDLVDRNRFRDRF